jgi:ornithine cyclodeaminase/alanine dehydrogenase-like protein (mu-crystallin family)
MLLLTRSDLQRALPMSEAIDFVKGAFIELSTGRAIIPLRMTVPLEEHGGSTLFMPGYLSLSDALAIKVVSVRNRNPERGLPLIHALVILIDPATGEPLAAIEGGYLTALRTGAASGLATDLLARKDAEVAAIFGAGVQARTQISAIASVRPVKRFWIYGRRRDQVEELINTVGPQLDSSIELLAALSPSHAIRDSDVVCTATTSHVPVFNGEDLKAGSHINGVGSFTPDMQEVDCLTLRRASKIVVDSRQGALSEAGDLLVAISRGQIQPSDLYAEIGEIAAGLRPGRENGSEITYFKSVGNAVQDVAIAQALYHRARINNLGLETDLLT